MKFSCLKVARLRFNSNERGFTMIEAMAALGLSGAVIAACLFLAGESSNQIGKRVQGSKGFLALQSLSEQLLVSNGTLGDLNEGDHGPIYYDINGRTVDSGPISVTWHVTLNDPSPNIIKIKTNADWGPTSLSHSGSDTANLIVYRSAPLRGSSTTIERVPLTKPTPTPVPSAAPTTYSWKLSNSGNCGSGNVKIQTYYCNSSTSGMVADSFCPSPKPAAKTVSCNVTSYAWYAGPWEQSCTNGTHSRVVYCKGSDGLSYDPPQGSCLTTTKPNETESCAECYPFCK